MNRLLLTAVSLSLMFSSFSAFAGEKAPAPKPPCACASHAGKCAGDCCSACKGGEGCACATDGCKSCSKCGGKKP